MPTPTNSEFTFNLPALGMDMSGYSDDIHRIIISGMSHAFAPIPNDERLRYNNYYMLRERGKRQQARRDAADAILNSPMVEIPEIVLEAILSYSPEYGAGSDLLDAVYDLWRDSDA